MIPNQSSQNKEYSDNDNKSKKNNILQNCELYCSDRPQSKKIKNKKKRKETQILRPS